MKIGGEKKGQYTLTAYRLHTCLPASRAAASARTTGRYACTHRAASHDQKNKKTAARVWTVVSFITTLHSSPCWHCGSPQSQLKRARMKLFFRLDSTLRLPPSCTTIFATRASCPLSCCRPSIGSLRLWTSLYIARTSLRP